MSTFKNVSTSGALELPLIGRVIEAGEVFTVTAEQGNLLAAQPDVWQRVDKGDDRPIAELRAELKALDLSTSGTKEILLERLAAARATTTDGTDTGDSSEGEGTE